jgi:hypothetical protein
MMSDSETFFRRMGERFQIQFGCELETVWSIISMRHVSTRLDGAQFTPEQAAWIAGFEAGWSDHAS